MQNYTDGEGGGRKRINGLFCELAITILRLLYHKLREKFELFSNYDKLSLNLVKLRKRVYDCFAGIKR